MYCISNWPHCYFGAAPRKCIAWQSFSFILVLSEFIWLRWWSGFSNRANILCGAKEWTRLQPAFDCEGVRAAQLMVSLRSSLWSPLEISTNPPILFRKTDSSCIGLTVDGLAQFNPIGYSKDMKRHRKAVRPCDVFSRKDMSWHLFLLHPNSGSSSYTRSRMIKDDQGSMKLPNGLNRWQLRTWCCVLSRYNVGGRWRFSGDTFRHRDESPMTRPLESFFALCYIFQWKVRVIRKFRGNHHLFPYICYSHCCSQITTVTFWVFSSDSIVTLKAARPHEHEGKERLPKDQRERWTIFDFTIFTCKLNLTFEIVEEFGSCKIHLDRVSTSHHPVFKIKTCNSSLFALTCQCMYFWPHPSLWRGQWRNVWEKPERFWQTPKMRNDT